MEHWELVAREQVRDTVAAYNHCGDRFLLDEMVACFTVDGVLESKGDWVVPDSPFQVPAQVSLLRSVGAQVWTPST